MKNNFCTFLHYKCSDLRTSEHAKCACITVHSHVIVTARVQSTREGTVFTGVRLSTFRWAVYSHLANGGTPSGLQGYPIQPMGGTPIWLMGGVPPNQDWMGVPPCWDWMGVPHHQDWMVSPPPAPIKTGCGSSPPVRRSGDKAATRWAVCLLHSSRWTFLIFCCFLFFFQLHCHVIVR